MSTNAQIEANRLNACPETHFAAKPEEEAKFKALFLRLRKDCQPDSDLEEAAFHRFAWATFQADRARRFEQFTEDRWFDSPDNQQLFSQMERILKHAMAQERRADKALKE